MKLIVAYITTIFSLLAFRAQSFSIEMVMNRCVLGPGHGCTPKMTIVTKGDAQPIIEVMKLNDGNVPSVEQSHAHYNTDSEADNDGYVSSDVPSPTGFPMVCERCYKDISPRRSSSSFETEKNNALGNDSSEGDNDSVKENANDDDQDEEEFVDDDDSTDALDPDEYAMRGYEDSVGNGQTSYLEMERCLQYQRMGCPYTLRSQRSTYNPQYYTAFSPRYARTDDGAQLDSSSDDNRASGDETESTCPFANRSQQPLYYSYSQPQYRVNYKPTCRRYIRYFSPCRPRPCRQTGYQPSRYGNSFNNEINYALEVVRPIERSEDYESESKGSTFQVNHNDSNEGDENGNFHTRDLINDSENGRDASTTVRVTNGMFNVDVGKSADSVMKHYRDLQTERAATNAGVKDTGNTEKTDDIYNMSFIETARQISYANNYASVAPHLRNQPSGGMMSNGQKDPTFYELGSNNNMTPTNGITYKKRNRDKSVARLREDDDYAVDFDNFMAEGLENNGANENEANGDPELVGEDYDDNEDDNKAQLKEQNDERDDDYLEQIDQRENDEHENNKHENDKHENDKRDNDYLDEILEPKREGIDEILEPKREGIDEILEPKREGIDEILEPKREGIDEILEPKREGIDEILEPKREGIDEILEPKREGIDEILEPKREGIDEILEPKREGIDEILEPKREGIDEILEPKREGIDEILEPKREGIDEILEPKREGIDEILEPKREGIDEILEPKREGIDEILEPKREGIDEILEHENEGIDEILEPKNEGIDDILEPKREGIDDILEPKREDIDDNGNDDEADAETANDNAEKEDGEMENDVSNATAESSSPTDDAFPEDSDDESDDVTDVADYIREQNVDVLRTPPGLEYLGSGYDMVKGNPLGDTITLLDPGYRANIIQMHWRKDFEGVSNSLLYMQPKGAWVRSYVSCHKSDTVSEVGKSKSLKNALSVDASVSAEVPGDSLKFAASASYNNVKNSESQKGLKKYVSRSYCLNYVAGIPSSIPWDYTTAFTIALKQLPTKFEHERDGVICSPSIYRDNPTSKACLDLGVRPWMRFFTIFGTHVTTKIYLGGKMVTLIETKASQEAKLKKLGIDVKAEISVQAQVATANGAVGVGVSKLKDSKNESLDSKKSTLALGGDIYGKGKNLSFNDWAETVSSFSMPVKAEYTPIANFLGKNFVDAYNDAYVFYGKVLVGENV
ncbi:mac/perforin domain containing protein, putative [Babesia bigemina]|uniref:Mac/perforin domain containing protein, putative n=1 Tax=Babesia bigemina TaxID=5866 RepID=A0A061CZD6_BABBI|nr:mac/perforin domain containing protein, putative [Babesia bigemina]CDR93986.1 mac/perforin domain containing protein, putative [Babesia bigemina]|eukprot:XP_012766172.1 mac/perforin domain containing protein, putative [Babesia bigemina]